MNNFKTFTLLSIGIVAFLTGCTKQSKEEQKPGSPPTAEATVQEGSSSTVGTITLDGTGSSDPDGDSLTFEWTVQSAPSGNTPARVTSNPTDSIAYHNVNEAGNYIFQLTVDEGIYDPVSDTVHFKAVEGGNPPVAVVPEDFSARVNEEVELDGSDSHDPDGGDLSYSWALVSNPSQSQASISNKEKAVASITPDLAGNYLIELLVVDPEGKTGKDQFTLSVSE